MDYAAVRLYEDGRRADFETNVTFIITPTNTNPGEGLTFFMCPLGSYYPWGSEGGGLGVFTWPIGAPDKVFAVEFDNHVNGESDPSYRHIGIDLGSIRSSNTTWVGTSLLGQVVTARIKYVAAISLITVNVEAGSQRFEVSLVFDLSALLYEQVQVGLSASTSQGATALHNIISWSFTSSINTDAARISQIVV